MLHRSLLFLLFLPFFPVLLTEPGMSDAVAVGVTKSKRAISNFLRSLCSSLKCCFFIYYFVVHDVYDILKLYRHQRIRSTSKRSLLPCKKRLFRYVRSKYRCKLTPLLSCLNFAKVQGYSLASFRIGLLLVIKPKTFCLRLRVL